MLVSEVSGNAITGIEYGSPTVLTNMISAAFAKCFGTIHEKQITFDELFAPNASSVFLVYSEDYPRTDEEKDAAIQRAKSRLGEKQYCLTCNNCENFVTWALSIKPISIQWRDASTVRRFLGDFVTTLISEVLNAVHLLKQRYHPNVKLEILSKYVSFLKEECLQHLPENQFFDNLKKRVSSIKELDLLITIICTLLKIVNFLVESGDSLPKNVCEITKIVVCEIYSLLGYKRQLLEIFEKLDLWRKNLISTVDLLREMFKIGVLLAPTICFPHSVPFVRQIIKYSLIRAVASAVGGCIFDKAFSFIHAW
ncbi:hypothetical protein CHS0354_017697 [Potamilus streckersoni]|uniref:LRAT domain-containing protein n=1 Tax=Potamilus streckersoni TaxID=2493646 RepID=A0AAE0RU51_9BIVA|nr:hypothetical protein CHS0354_017697 [Potamilus streckersoni]